MVAEVIAVTGMFGVFLLRAEALAGAFTVGGLVMSFQVLPRAWMQFGALLRCVSNLRENDLLLAEFHEFLDLPPSVRCTARSRAVGKS